ncbi:hypothetical protein BDK51DRAFT_26695 [Blyttiomyces helicus]|uniref:RGS domain-containing protein n=1 Tax=Blyttiomyces helicus TaxID=388810 RepID=A0A4P9W4U0_9FUNG|nr:hypothetical protein BDK51DRAFT_26695 [Blyttiomyces helicus]|eukprot:RKO87234.1 hypothetical protein BDK51DRAFT_26695 [Blyttiomyces helicus]
MPCFIELWFPSVLLTTKSYAMVAKCVSFCYKIKPSEGGLLVWMYGFVLSLLVVGNLIVQQIPEYTMGIMFALGAYPYLLWKMRGIKETRGVRRDLIVTIVASTICYTLYGAWAMITPTSVNYYVPALVWHELYLLISQYTMVIAPVMRVLKRKRTLNAADLLNTMDSFKRMLGDKHLWEGRATVGGRREGQGNLAPLLDLFPSPCLSTDSLVLALLQMPSWLLYPPFPFPLSEEFKKFAATDFCAEQALCFEAYTHLQSATFATLFKRGDEKPPQIQPTFLTSLFAKIAHISTSEGTGIGWKLRKRERESEVVPAKCVESMDDSRRFAEMSIPDGLAAEFGDFYERFVKEGAELEVDLPSAVRKKIESVPRAAWKVGVFDDVRDAVLDRLSSAVLLAVEAYGMC